MLSGTLDASLLGNILTDAWMIKQVKEQLELVKIFNVASSFNKHKGIIKMN